MACPTVRGDNLQALTSGLLMYRWTNMVHLYLFYTIYISVDLAHHDLFRAKVGKGGIICYKQRHIVVG